MKTQTKQKIKVESSQETFIFALHLSRHRTEVHFASFLFGEFTTMAVVDQPENKLDKQNFFVARVVFKMTTGAKCCKVPLDNKVSTTSTK